MSSSADVERRSRSLSHAVCPSSSPTKRAGHRKPPRGGSPRLALTSAGDGLLEVIAVRVSATESTIQIGGALSGHNAQLATAVLDHQLTTGQRCVRLDLSRLTAIDEMGLHAIAGAHRSYRDAQATLVLTGVSPQTRRVVSAQHLDRMLFMTDDATADVGFALKPAAE